MTEPAPEKHPCPDCSCCQWCSDERCRVCLSRGGCRGRKKRSIAEQIALFDSLNESDAERITQ
ncbi:MAG: hypothetical protein PHI31_17120 [Desulfuromonadaceae bacterium]|nr:hypothetical protein [Desulfuromonadaceae bacterium]